MMILSEPNITPEAIAHLGKQMALLFRQVIVLLPTFFFNFYNPCFQDEQLWEVKASQLNEWVERGLLNVKLLDRTLAYFQNQSSFLQYIKTFKGLSLVLKAQGSLEPSGTSFTGRTRQ